MEEQIERRCAALEALDYRPPPMEEQIERQCAALEAFARLDRVHVVAGRGAAPPPVIPQLGFIPSVAVGEERARWGALPERVNEMWATLDVGAQLERAFPRLRVSLLQECGLVVAGGAVAAILVGYGIHEDSDCDLFFAREVSDEEVMAVLRRLVAELRPSSIRLSCCALTLLFAGARPPFGDAHRPVQVVLRPAEGGVAQLIREFELGPCQVAFDGYSAFATDLGVLGAASGWMLPPCQRTATPASNQRVVKYLERGYALAVTSRAAFARLLGTGELGPLRFADRAAVRRKEQPPAGFSAESPLFALAASVALAPGARPPATFREYLGDGAPAPGAAEEGGDPLAEARALFVAALEAGALLPAGALAAAAAGRRGARYPLRLEELAADNAIAFWGSPPGVHRRLMVSAPAGPEDLAAPPRMLPLAGLLRPAADCSAEQRAARTALLTAVGHHPLWSELKGAGLLGDLPEGAGGDGSEEPDTSGAPGAFEWCALPTPPAIGAWGGADRSPWLRVAVSADAWLAPETWAAAAAPAPAPA
jgi:hypothetical protein